MTSSVADQARLELLQAIIHRASSAVVIWEADQSDGVLRIRYLNPAFTEMTGYAIDDVRGTDRGRINGNSDDVEANERIRAALDLGDACRELLLLHRMDGREFWAEAVYFVLPDETGARRYGVGLYRDLTDQRHEEARFRSLIENVSDVVAVIDANSIVRYMSPAVERLGPLVASEMIGRSIHDFLDGKDRTSHEEFLAEIAAKPGTHGPLVVNVGDGAGRDYALELVLTNRLDDPAVAGIVVTARDVGERQRAEHVLAQSERRFRALVQNSTDIITLLGPDGSVRYASPSVERVLGLPPGSDRGRNLLERVHTDDMLHLRAAIADGSVPPGVSDPIEVRMRALDGTWRYVEVLGRNLIDDPDVGGLVLNGRDVTDRRHFTQLLAQEASLLEAIARSSPTEHVLRRISMMVERLLPGAQASVGVLEPDGVIRHHSAPTLAAELVTMLDETDPGSELGSTLRTGGEPLVIFPDVVADPRWHAGVDSLVSGNLAACWALTVTAPTTGELLGALTVFTTEARAPLPDELELLRRSMHLAAIAIERGKFESRLEHQALHDSLTGLPNRTLLLDRIGHGLARAARRRALVAVLFVDLDQFKVINDSLGHAAGDRLLQQVATRLQRALRAGDTVGRFGGDEFLVLCEDVESEAGSVEVAERIAGELRGAFELDGAEVFVTASIGIALATDEGALPESLIRDADAAMYRAKERGRNRYELFEADLHRRVVQRLELERALRLALPARELRVHYQPRVRLADGRFTGVEALVRWERPGVGLVGASDIVPVAEETGLIVPLGEWVLAEACRQATEWDAVVPGPPLSVFVNLSARQVSDPNLLDTVTAVLDRTGLAPERLCLEVTESVLFHDADATSAALLRLKAIGVRLAIDDFGTGYATLDYVRRFSMADELKIDRTFVAGLDQFDSPDAAIVSAAIVLANALGFETVAEGVETATQLSVLRRLGCDQAQGFYFSPPLPADEVVTLLAGQGHIG